MATQSALKGCDILILQYKQLDFNPKYYISNRGFVVSVTKKSFKILKPRLDAHGYSRVYIRNIELGQRKDYFIHRLVAMAFLEHPEGYDEVNHIDGNKTNNSIENLEWSNRSLNNIHAYENNLHVPAYKPCVVDNVHYNSQSEAAIALGVSRTSIDNWIKAGRGYYIK